jgi:hypothetical protein
MLPMTPDGLQRYSSQKHALRSCEEPETRIEPSRHALKDFRTYKSDFFKYIVKPDRHLTPTN